MDFGGVPFSAVPFGGNLITDADFTITLSVQIDFPASFDFFGEIGDIIIIPPDAEFVPADLQYRRSPCMLYEN